MKNTANNNATYTIDAAGKSLGRVASEAAKMLMGKTLPSYTPNIRSNVKVQILNASKLTMRERQSIQKIYTSNTGYPGGFKQETLAHLTGRKGHAEAMRRAIERMMPRNTMRTARLKNLTITE